MQDIDRDRGARQTEELRERGGQVRPDRESVESGREGFIGGASGTAVQFEVQVEPGRAVQDGVGYFVGAGGGGGGGVGGFAFLGGGR